MSEKQMPLKQRSQESGDRRQEGRRKTEVGRRKKEETKVKIISVFLKRIIFGNFIQSFLYYSCFIIIDFAVLPS